MIEKRTVLVSGAGSSIPYGFPNGKKLKDEIYTTVVNRSNSFLNKMATQDILDSFIDRLKYSPEESIDAFLEHEIDEEIIKFGKMAIVATLLPYEKEAYLFDNFIAKEEDEKYFNWYRFLWNQINTSFDDFEQNLSVITFNYDRSLEYYLYTALKHKYPGKKEEEYKNKLDDIPVFHIYGQLGYLPFGSKGDKKSIPYDYNWKMAEIDFYQFDEKKTLIENVSQEIKIVHEGETINEPIEIRTMLNYAERIYFLGFGFNTINLTRLIGNVKLDDCEIKGTMFNLSLKAKNEAGKILNEFKKSPAFNWKNHFHDITIYDFLYHKVIL
jgi:hypothetical protein